MMGTRTPPSTSRDRTRFRATRDELRSCARLFVFSALAACGGASAPVHRPDLVAIDDGGTAVRSAVAAGRAPTTREHIAIARLSRTAERIRGLHFVHEVPVRVLDADAIRAALAHEMKDDDLREARDLYVALGLLPADVDVREMMLRVLGEQVIGFYDTHTKALVVRDDIMARLAASTGGGALDESGMVLVHELVHALQDQDLDLGTAYDAREHASMDGSDAFRSLVEGDATLAMIGYLAERSGGDLSMVTRRRDVLDRIVTDAAPPSGDELSRAPAIVREPLLSSYMDGMVFCATLHARGGFAAVDAAHHAPPRSTEQILHPEKYLASEEPEEITLPPLPAIEAAGLHPIVEQTLGELETRVYFAQVGIGSPTPAATATFAAAAAGWAGDRIRIYGDASGARSVVWLTRWDTEADATEAARAALAVVTYDGIANGGMTEAHRELVARDGRDVLVLRNIDPALQEGVTSVLLSPTHASR